MAHGTGPRCFPCGPSPGHGSEAFNRELLRQQKEETEANDRAVAAEVKNSPAAVQRRELLAIVDQRVDERFEQRVAELLNELLEAPSGSAVAQLRERLRSEGSA
jgi:hypothetical protein